MRPIFALIAVLAVSACQTTSETPTGELLSPAQIKAEWSGHPLQIFIPTTARTFSVKFNDDWSTAFSAKGDYQDTGTWRLSDIGYCTKWAKIRDGKEECYTVRKSGSEYRIYKLDGSVDAKATLL